jgi:Tfp pilus assembly protein PilF
VALLLVVIAYANSFRNSFHFDDSHVVENNLYIRSLRNVPRFFVDAHTFSSLPQNSTYRPLVSLTLAIDYALGHGLDPLPFHLTQLLLLVALGAMLVAFYKSVLDAAEPAPANPYIALFTATLFCVHTANTETMNLISARSEILACLGIVGSFLVYMTAPGLRRLHIYLVPVMIGALAKATALIFPALLMPYLILFPQAEMRRGHCKRIAEPKASLSDALRQTWLDWAVSIAGLILLGKMNAPEWTSGSAARWPYARTQPFIWIRYFRLFLVPVGLNADTDLHPFDRWTDERVFVGAAFIVLLVWMIRASSRTRLDRPIAFGLSWFAIALLPTSSFFPLAEVMNDHRMFMPFIGLALAVVYTSVMLSRRMSGVTARETVLVAVGAILLLAHIIGTHQRNKVWRSEETLWRDVVRTSPANGRALMNYGLTQMSQGRYETARAYFQQATVYTPAYSILEINLGIVEGTLGHQEDAEQHFRRALQIQPDGDAHFYYGRWLVEHGRAPEAIPHLEEAVRLSPAAAYAPDLLMQVYAAAGRMPELNRLASDTANANPQNEIAQAIVHGRLPIERRSYDAAFRTGLAAANQGRFVDGALEFRSAILMNPQSSDAWNNLGWSLGKLGFYAEAVPPLERALALRPDFELARNNLAWVRQSAEAK